MEPRPDVPTRIYASDEIPGRIAYNTFVVMAQRLPRLGWRYVVDRASFYESARRPRE